MTVRAIAYPLLFDFDTTFIDELRDESSFPFLEKMRKERDKLKDEAKDFSSKFIFNLFKVLLEIMNFKDV